MVENPPGTHKALGSTSRTTKEEEKEEKQEEWKEKEEEEENEEKKKEEEEEEGELTHRKPWRATSLCRPVNERPKTGCRGGKGIK